MPSPRRRHRRTRNRCPECGQGLIRVPRWPEDRDTDAAATLHRYRCRSADCDWRGLLPSASAGPAPANGPAARPAATAPESRVRTPAAQPLAPPPVPAGPPVWRRAAPAVLLAGVTVAVGALLTQALIHGEPTDLLRTADGRVIRLGESEYGEALPPTHPLLQRVVHLPATEPSADGPAPLQLRRHCAWGRPGGNPYQGSVEQALTSARLPESIVRDIAAKVKAGAADDQLVINNTGIRGEKKGREFNQHSFAMTYGRTLCLDTRVNFAPGHVERAALYEAADGQGKRYAVMVPEVCGNVSVLSERGQRMPRALMASASVLKVEEGDGVDALQTVAQVDGRALPEPGTLLGVLTGLGLLAWARRRP